MLILLGSHGSPGTTTTAFLISYFLAQRPDVEKALLVEADPTGGTLSAMLPLDQNRGIVSLLTASTQTPNIWEHTQKPPGANTSRLEVLCGPLAIRGSWDSTEILGIRAPEMLSAVNKVPTVVDGGRVLNTSPVFKMFGPQTTIAIVIREGYLPGLPALNYAREKSEEAGAKAGIITIGNPVWGDREYLKTTGMEVFGGLTENPRGFIDLPATISKASSRGMRKYLMPFRDLSDTLFDMTYGGSR